jgi:hypothetical protein
MGLSRRKHGEVLHFSGVKLIDPIEDELQKYARLHNVFAEVHLETDVYCSVACVFTVQHARTL